MKLKTQYIITIDGFDVTSLVSSYKFQGGPEQAIRYLEMEVPKRSINNKYPSLADSVVEGKSQIYIDAVGHGTFIISKLWLDGYNYEFIAFGVETTLNTSVLSEPISTTVAVNPACTAYKIFGDWLDSVTSSGILTGDVFDIWFSKSFAKADATKEDGYDHSQPNTDSRHPIRFLAGMQSMVAMNLCSLMDDAFIFFANGTDSQNRAINRLYYVRYGDDVPLAYNPQNPPQNGTVNLYPDVKSQYRAYTRFDIIISQKLAGLAGKNAEGSESITNRQAISCSPFSDGTSVQSTAESQESIELYGEYSSPTIISELICADESDVEVMAQNIVKRYKDPTRSVSITLTEVAKDANDKVGWEEIIPAYSYAKKINDTVNKIELTSIHLCDNTPDDSLLRLSTYIRSYPETTTEYTFGVLKDTTMAQELVSNLTGSLGSVADVRFKGSSIVSNGVLSVESLLGLIYPVGSIYVNTSDATNPATIFGFGTWEQIGEGNVLLAGSTSGDFQVGNPYGSNTTSDVPKHTHSFTTGTDGAHSHNVGRPSNPSTFYAKDVGNPDGWDDYDSNDNRGYVTTSSNVQSGYDGRIVQAIASGSAHSHTGTTNNNSGTDSISIMQQSIAVYMWKRTA